LAAFGAAVLCLNPGFAIDRFGGHLLWLCRHVSDYGWVEIVPTRRSPTTPVTTGVVDFGSAIALRSNPASTAASPKQLRKMAQTTLFPAAQFPSCVTACGSLYDVNGACVPPAAPTADPSVYDSCFCNDPRLAPFKTGTSGVCDGACANAADLSSIRNWFTSFCNNGVAGDTTSTPSASSRPGNNGGAGQTWLEGHYQWVVFLVIMVVAIIGIWVGACIWRRRYIRKKDKAYALGTNLARTTESGRVVPHGGSSAGSVHVPGPGMFDPAPISSAGVYGEKSQKKKWTFRERT